MENQMLPPCQAACPIHQDIREYVSLIAQGKFDKAMEVIMEKNPMPASCGAICAHHCEEECRRKDVDKPISIRILKSFAVEQGVNAQLPQKATDLAKKVAIIGSGPAGLTAAQTLACLGYSITVFEREKTFGGALRNYIPLYRLPDSTIDKDIENLKKLGIKFVPNCELGRNISITKLKEEFDAVILSLGLCTSRGLNIPGAEHPKNTLALPFLKGVKYEGLSLSGENVIVVGGGNVAMDVARSALRAGAGIVKIACLESDEEMPAFDWEIKEASEEGVEFFCSVGPLAVLTENGKITGMKVKAVKSVFDAEGRFNPTFYEDKTSVITGDMVIFSIGQGADISCLEECNISTDERNRLLFDPEKMTTSIEGVFLCGEVATGPGTAVQGMSNGRKAALSVNNYLLGENLTDEEIPPLPQLVEDVLKKIKPISREEMPLAEAKTRVKNFDPVELGYTFIQALQEARRCLRCDAGAKQVLADCVHCLTCLRTCPYDVPIINSDGEVELRQEYCQSCGLCLAVCPARTIHFKSPDISDAEKTSELALADATQEKNGEPVTVIMACSYAPFAMDWYNQDFFTKKPANIKIVKFPCVAKIDTLHLLRAFEQGADTVLVAGCMEDDRLTCPYYDVMPWTEKRLDRARQVLEAVDINPENLQIAVIPPLDKEGFTAKVTEFAKNISSN